MCTALARRASVIAIACGLYARPASSRRARVSCTTALAVSHFSTAIHPKPAPARQVSTTLCTIMITRSPTRRRTRSPPDRVRTTTLLPHRARPHGLFQPITSETSSPCSSSTPYAHGALAVRRRGARASGPRTTASLARSCMRTSRARSVGRGKERGRGRRPGAVRVDWLIWGVELSRWIGWIEIVCALIFRSFAMSMC